jgi:hypothetical protein
MSGGRGDWKFGFALSRSFGSIPEIQNVLQCKHPPTDTTNKDLVAELGLGGRFSDC